MLKVFLHLRIKEVELKKDSEDIAPKKKFMTFKEKRKHLSRMQRKVMICAFWVLITYSIASIKKEYTYAGCLVASQDGLSNSPIMNCSFGRFVHWVSLGSGCPGWLETFTLLEGLFT